MNVFKKIIKFKKILLYLIVLIVIIAFLGIFYANSTSYHIDKICDTNVLISSYKTQYFISFGEYTSGEYVLNNENKNELVLIKNIRGNPPTLVSYDRTNKKIENLKYDSYLKLNKPLLMNNLFKLNIIGSTKEELIKQNDYFRSLEDFSIETPFGYKIGSRLIDEVGNDYFIIYYKDKKVESILINLDVEKNKNFFNEIFPSNTFIKSDKYFTLKENINSNVFYFADGTVSLKKDAMLTNNILCEIRLYDSSNIGFSNNFLTDTEFSVNK